MRSASRGSVLALLVLTLLVLTGLTPTAHAQTLPTAEPEILVITRERIRPGHSAAHVRSESERPRALAAAGSPDHYLAMASMTGAPEVWLVRPWATYADWSQSMLRQAGDAALQAALARVSIANAEHLVDERTIEAVAARDLGHGTEPNLNLVRYWHVTTLQVRPGHEDSFAASMQVYQAVADRADPNSYWRVYRVTNGMPRGTFLVFSAVEMFAQFDDALTADSAVEQAMAPHERARLQTFAREGLRRASANRFRLDPDMSHVSDDTRAIDPGFWRRR